MLPLVSLLCVLELLQLCGAWHEWNYSVQWSEQPNKIQGLKTNWEYYWGSKPSPGLNLNPDGAPRPRRGHSMDIIVTEPASLDYGGATLVVMFAGRDNEAKFTHIPKTYNVATVNGSIVFTTYDQKPVNACNDRDGQYYTPAQRAGCNFTESSRINVGVFYNDVWAYKMCTRSPEPDSTPAAVKPTATSATPKRFFNEPCLDTGWLLLHPGAPEGGCVIQLGILVCSVPSERYNHASAMFDDGTFYVYGGFSQRCADYCDDLWVFDVYNKAWGQIYSSYPGSRINLSKLYYDMFNGIEFTYTNAEVPRDNSTARNAGPAKRWRHTITIGEQYTVGSQKRQDFALFGGHRVWHGFSPENSQSNNWANYNTRPYGGYLNDLWVFTKYLDFETIPGAGRKKTNGRWKFIPQKEQCYSSPGITWESRFDVACTTVWPSSRAGHGSAYDSPRKGLWLFGGYNTYYPYLKTDGEGSDMGVTQTNRGGFVPYPGFSYYKNDLWFFNFTSGYWTEKVYNTTFHKQWPQGRMDMVFLLLGELIFLNGGFADNYYFEDTWYYNISTNLWLEKERFVYPLYHAECTDDLAYITKHSCTHLLWPKQLKREQYFPFKVVPYSKQEYYWPDSSSGPYFGIKPRGFSATGGVDPYTNRVVNSTMLKYKDQTSTGTPVVPYAATGPMQYVKPFTYSFNSTHKATISEACTSVYGEPTRGKVLDGQAGRSNRPVLIAQPRKQRPGWDGCGRRQDGRSDLPQILQYERPRARGGHRAVWIPATKEILMYGGISYKTEQVATKSDSYETVTRDDMWYFNLYHCLNNCSNHGICENGFCKCFTGYYGEDCSNISCPGTSCYYDEYTNDQVCVHACQAGYVHKDNDVYVPDVTKLPCSRHVPGEINGICDGFGSVQCAPPYIGDDCSIKDCKSNCSFNGWCSIEFPVSRCMCQPGYFGDICQHKLCLNNCSYPNGVCNTKTGFCNCTNIHSPFNMTRVFKPWSGEDCSWMWAYQGVPRALFTYSRLHLLTLILVILLLANEFDFTGAMVFFSSRSLGLAGA